MLFLLLAGPCEAVAPPVAAAGRFNYRHLPSLPQAEPPFSEPGACAINGNAERDKAFARGVAGRLARAGT
jgi:hypothetical protein